MQFKNLKWKQSMNKVINNIWSIIKLGIVLLVIIMVMSFVETSKVIETSSILLGFYLGYKGIDLLYLYSKNRILGNKKETNDTKVKEEINPEIKYVEGLISEISNKVKKTVKDKNTLDLLNIKLKQLKNV